MSVCDDNCRDCVFHAWMGFRLICNFLGVMGRRRGCPAGAGCAEKIVGEARQSIEALVYKLPPSSLSAGMPGIGPKAQYPEDSGETSSPNRSRGFDLGTEDGQSSGAETGDGETNGKRRKKELTAEEIAERKRKKAEYHREWAKKNREKVRAYQRERWRKKREDAEAGTGVPSSAPAGHLTPGEGKDERTGKDRG